MDNKSNIIRKIITKQFPGNQTRESRTPIIEARIMALYGIIDNRSNNA